MSKIFRVSGNLKKGDKRGTSCLFFVGKVIADDNGLFVGHCEKFYRYRLQEEGDAGYITGVLKEADGRSEMEFYLAQSSYDTLHCVVDDLDGPKDGCWERYYLPELDERRCFNSKKKEGDARIALTELSYSDDEAEQILRRYEGIDSTDISSAFAVLDLLVRNYGLECIA